MLTTAVVFLAALIGVLFFTCMYLVKRICPYNPMFSSLELEEIRVERVQDRERTIMGRIDRMKVGLINQLCELPLWDICCRRN